MLLAKLRKLDASEKLVFYSICWEWETRRQDGNAPQKLPFTVVERADMTRPQPASYAVEVKRVLQTTRARTCCYTQGHVHCATVNQCTLQRHFWTVRLSVCYIQWRQTQTSQPALQWPVTIVIVVKLVTIRSHVCYNPVLLTAKMICNYRRVRAVHCTTIVLEHIQWGLRTTDILLLLGTTSLFLIIIQFLADRTNGRAYATVLRLSSVCNVMYCG